MYEPSLDQYRYFLKDTIRQKINFSQTDQHRGIEPPSLEKPFPTDALRFDLPPVGQWEGIETVALTAAISDRQSRRSFKSEPLTLGELSFLLWATQGVREQDEGGTVFRTVPSAGNRHALETYLAVLRVGDLEPGFYRYLPLETNCCTCSKRSRCHGSWRRPHWDKPLSAVQRSCSSGRPSRTAWSGGTGWPPIRLSP